LLGAVVERAIWEVMKVNGSASEPRTANGAMSILEKDFAEQMDSNYPVTCSGNQRPALDLGA